MTNKVQLSVKIDSDIKKLIQYASKISGRTISDIVSEGVEQVANKIIFGDNIIILEKEDQEAFINSILNSSKPTQALIEAFKEYSRLTNKK